MKYLVYRTLGNKSSSPREYLKEMNIDIAVWITRREEALSLPLRTLAEYHLEYIRTVIRLWPSEQGYSYGIEEWDI